MKKNHLFFDRLYCCGRYCSFFRSASGFFDWNAFPSRGSNRCSNCIFFFFSGLETLPIIKHMGELTYIQVKGINRILPRLCSCCRGILLVRVIEIDSISINFIGALFLTSRSIIYQGRARIYFYSCLYWRFYWGLHLSDRCARLLDRRRYGCRRCIFR